MKTLYWIFGGVLVLAVGIALFFVLVSKDQVPVGTTELEGYSVFGKLEDAEFVEQYCQKQSLRDDCQYASEDQSRFCLRCRAIQEKQIPSKEAEKSQQLIVQKESADAALESVESESSYNTIKRQSEPLILRGNDTLVIEDTHFIIENSVELRDQAKLVISNSLLEFKNDHAHQYILEAYDNVEILVENSFLRSDKPMNWDFHGHSLLSLKGTQKVGNDDTWPWMTFSEDTSARVHSSKFDATVWDRGNLSVEDSLTFIELVFTDNSVVDERLSANRTNFVFPGEDERGISYKVNLKNSTIRGWGITVKTGSSITIRDGHRVISTVQIGWPWTGKTVVLDGLEQKVYQDQTWRIEDSTLRLVNTDVWFWSPGAFMDNTLIMRNSLLSDLAFGGDNSTTIVENSQVYFVRARDDQRFEIKDSRIESDVVATGNSVVTLINTQVGGKMVEQDNGRIIMK